MLPTLDSTNRTTLETILQRASSASRFVSHVHERAADTIVGPLANNIDQITRGLSELLGNPRLIVSNAGSAILTILLERAASAARLVSYIEDDVDGGLAVGPLADEIDAIVHELSELLGNPCLIAASLNARSTFASRTITRDDVITRDGVLELVAPDAPEAGGRHTFSLGSPPPCAALAIEREASRTRRTNTFSLRTDDKLRSELAPVSDPTELVIAFINDESTRPRVPRLRATHGRQCQRLANAPKTIGTEAVPANGWQARARRVRVVEDARSGARWVRGATVTALIVLVGLGLWVLGFGGGDR